jgi:hypothetical protein
MTAAASPPRASPSVRTVLAPATAGRTLRFVQSYHVTRGDTMCHHHEARDWEAILERAREHDELSDEPAPDEAEPDPEPDEVPTPADD